MAMGWVMGLVIGFASLAGELPCDGMCDVWCLVSGVWCDIYAVLNGRVGRLWVGERSLLGGQLMGLVLNRAVGNCLVSIFWLAL
jgi:hypothetical protein